MEGFTMARRSKQEYLRSIYDRYQHAPRAQKGTMLARLSGFDPLDNFFRVLSSQFPRRGEPEMGLNSL